jgi:hypothetical protein
MFLKKGVSLSVSVLTLTAISVDRYYIIYKPLKVRSICTNKKIKIVLMMIWSISIFLMSPLLMVFKYEKRYIVTPFESSFISIKMCFEHWPYFELKLSYEILLICVLFLFPTIFMAYAYDKIAKTLWLNEKNQQQQCDEQNNISLNQLNDSNRKKHKFSTNKDEKKKISPDEQKNQESIQISDEQNALDHNKDFENNLEDDTKKDEIKEELAVQYKIKKSVHKDISKEIEYSLLDVSSGDEQADPNTKDGGGNNFKKVPKRTSLKNKLMGKSADKSSPKTPSPSRIERPLHLSSKNSNNSAAMDSLIYQLKIYNSHKNKILVMKNLNRNEMAICKLIESRKRVVKLVIILIFLFLVSWTPYHFVSVCIDFTFYWELKTKSNITDNDMHSDAKSSVSSIFSYYIYPITLCLALGNSATNPVCYMILSHGFRTMFKASLNKCLNLFRKKK